MVFACSLMSRVCFVRYIVLPSSEGLSVIQVDAVVIGIQPASHQMRIVGLETCAVYWSMSCGHLAVPMCRLHYWAMTWKYHN